MIVDHDSLSALAVRTGHPVAFVGKDGGRWSWTHYNVHGGSGGSNGYSSKLFALRAACSGRPLDECHIVEAKWNGSHWVETNRSEVAA